MPLKRPEQDAVGFLLRHLLAGAVAGTLFGAILLTFDIGHLRTLATETGDGVAYLLLLFFGLFVTFGGVAMATGIMTLARNGK